MPNVFQLGMTALKEWTNIERAIKLSQPVLDAYNANRKVVDEVRDLIDRLEKLKVEVMPILDAYQQVDDELVPLVSHISNAFFPHAIQQHTKPVATPADGFNVKWLQQSLVDLAKRGKFNWVDSYVDKRSGKTVHVRQDRFVDDDYGQDTKVEVNAYQRAVLDRGTSGWEEKDVDSWAGMKTCAAIYNDLASS